ncbi:hypothetical protein LOTGIDRAFT_169936 [Lottia gigantea]|uniref:Uncharacterized protein n=1 Tax=Lottia gigantea TaxID=225164 RepID=V3ZNN0_LOTGI|nr:hypothetical protein LOTGIDRAFT_169936 [Lottia gigantea]ESO82466.1 hypothetical protein LOTGIDRAFT_169936 [Lottia gigantea]
MSLSVYAAGGQLNAIVSYLEIINKEGGRLRGYRPFIDKSNYRVWRMLLRYIFGFMLCMSMIVLIDSRPASDLLENLRVKRGAKGEGTGSFTKRPPQFQKGSKDRHGKNFCCNKPPG